MNRAQIVDLLTYCAACDQRTVGDTDVAVWFDMLAPLDFDKALTAARTHYRRQPDVRLKPGHIWTMCRTATDSEVDPALRQHCEQGTYCDDCKCVHQPGEPCNVLGPAPENVRAITSASSRAALVRRPPADDRASNPLAQSLPMPPSDLDLLAERCNCGATYLDNPPGHASHRTVFGHEPRRTA